LNELNEGAQLDDPDFNPFPGLRPFEGRNEQLFFGRELQVDQLLSRLESNRFLAIVGTSASGKSSLVRAGLLPALYGGAMSDAGSHWKIATMRPGSDPIANLATALEESGALDATASDRATRRGMARAVLDSGALGLVELMQQARPAEGDNVLVFVDQFEELFRFKKSRSVESADQAALFVRLLLEAAEHEFSRIYVLLTMRSDFLGDCAQFHGLPERINEGLFLVPRLSREQLRDAIEGPIGVAGAEIAPRLVNRLLNSVGDDPDQLPVLQHALMRTWQMWKTENAPDAPIDIEQYEAIGQLAGALSLHGDEIYSGLPDDRSRLIAERLFKAVTDRGSDSRGIRRPTRFDELCAIVGASEADVREVIDVFRAPENAFLMPPATTALESGTVIDITHESLMRVWERLLRWVDEEADSARIYRRLASDAQRGAAPWRNPDLAEARAWLQRNRDRINEAWAARYAS
jgi:energy-coupling factor transporter ATP-binding protein EcfA2